jgi:hypothetical protein
MTKIKKKNIRNQTNMDNEKKRKEQRRYIYGCEWVRIVRLSVEFLKIKPIKGCMRSSSLE